MLISKYYEIGKKFIYIFENLNKDKYVKVINAY